MLEPDANDLSLTDSGRAEPGFPEAQFLRLGVVAQLLRAAPVAAGPRLLWREPGGAVRTWPLAAELVIGRAAGCGLMLAVPQVSRRHCRVWRVAGEYWIADLGSTGGTRVNEQPIRRQPLRDGDLIEVGGVGLVFVLQ